MLIELGLTSAKEGYRAEGSDEVQHRPLEGARVLHVHPPDDITTGEIFVTVTAPNGVVRNHSEEQPAWVHCPDKPGLEALLAEHYGCAVGRPDDVEETHYTLNGPPGVDNSAPPVEGA
jgi:hypothetical protein